MLAAEVERLLKKMKDSKEGIKMYFEDLICSSEYFYIDGIIRCSLNGNECKKEGCKDFVSKFLDINNI
ncbi:MAG: hypothetical protein WC720_05365 [Candidatus Shapirobacteria bacterium]|jgi:hypothetical protein